MLKLKIALIRCGATAGNEERRFLGLRDEPLSRRGREMLAKRRKNGAYPDVTLVYSDEMLRSRETAAAIYPRVPAVITRELRAFDYGAFEGKTPSELLEDKLFDEWIMSEQTQACPGGEHPFAFQARCMRVFRSVVGEMSAKGIEWTAIVTHQTVISAIMQRYYMPRSSYNNWELDWGGAHIIEHDSLKLTAQLLKTI